MKPLIRPATWTAAIALLILLVAAVAARRRAPAASVAQPPPEVSVLTVAPQTVPARSEYVDQAAAPLSVEVRSQVTGGIVERPYAKGTDVAEGALLLRTDPQASEDPYRPAPAPRRT